MLLLIFGALGFLAGFVTIGSYVSIRRRFGRRPLATADALAICIVAAAILSGGLWLVVRDDPGPTGVVHAFFWIFVVPFMPLFLVGGTVAAVLAKTPLGRDAKPQRIRR